MRTRPDELKVIGIIEAKPEDFAGSLFHMQYFMTIFQITDLYNKGSGVYHEC